VLKILSSYKQTFLALAEGVLINPLKLFCTNICNFPENVFFCFFYSGVTVVILVLQKRNHKDKNCVNVLAKYHCSYSCP
jgi:hypothetical protein